jgi:simple sugar transport system ATP-binding protein
MGDFLVLRRISKRFGGVQALSQVDFDLRDGEIHCLVGENGSGKSTLIKIISGVWMPEPGGEIVIAGDVLSHLTPVESTRRGIQVIYQDLSLFPNLTVAENIGIAQHLRPVPGPVRWRAVRRAAEAAIAQIGVALPLDRRVESLSIANRQIVAICRALAADAKLVIMDEPTASLTRHEVDGLMSVVADLQKKGIATVFVSHRLNEVMEIAERVTVLRDGALVGTYDAREMDHHKLAYLMTGQEFRYEFHDGPVSQAAPVVEVRHLTKAGQYEDVSLTVRAGEIVGLTGLLGAGRTELALSLFGMNPPDSGDVLLGGRPLKLASNRDAIEQGIAYVSEDRLSLGLVMDQSIGANMIITILGELVDWSGLIEGKRRRATIDRWIADLRIKVGDPENPVKTLSGGNQQRVVLAKWIATGPKLLILDSPTVGVDIAAKSGIYEIVKGLAARGVAVILISDEIPEVLYHTHRVLVMRQGRIAGEFLPQETSEEQLGTMVNA